MGCDWIDGECAVVGYGLDYVSLFVDDDESDTIGYDGEIDDREFDPFVTIRSAWKKYLEQHGFKKVLDKNIEPHIGLTTKPGSYESCRYKSGAVVVFGS
jgi:hypothetical protein